jgi:hypothetical protein
MSDLGCVALNTSGTAKKGRKARTDGKAKKGRVRRMKGMTAKRRIALVVGSVGTFVLALSVWHCTEALAALTGSPVFLAALLAVGLDAGMVACELAGLASDGKARRWADAYVYSAAGLSAVLNSWASGAHASGSAWLAYSIGAVIPGLVLVLAKVAGHLWAE